MVEFYCYNCKGIGEINLTEEKIPNTIGEVSISYKKRCKVCKGTGKLDWVDHLISENSLINWEIVKIFNHGRI
jgi:DnaJ-class molecular chaperone